MRDTLPTSGVRQNESGIVNLDDTEGPGTHWVAYAKRDDRVVYFDSFGNLQPPRELTRYLRKKKKKIVVKIEYNRTSRQRYDQSNCGKLCLQFLHTVDDRYGFKTRYLADTNQYSFDSLRACR